MSGRVILIRFLINQSGHGCVLIKLNQSLDEPSPLPVGRWIARTYHKFFFVECLICLHCFFADVVEEPSFVAAELDSLIFWILVISGFLARFVQFACEWPSLVSWQILPLVSQGVFMVELEGFCVLLSRLVFLLFR